jgi:hypothetical protein
MDIKEIHLLATFKNVNDFGAKYAADFAPDSTGGKQFAIIAAAVPKAGTLGAQQISGKGEIKAAVKSKAVAYKQIHDDMLDINKAAHSLSLLGTAGLDGKFLMPHARGGQKLLDAARSFKKDATPLSAQLIGLGLDAQFLTTLGNHIDDYENANSTKGQGRDAIGGGVGGMADTAHQAAIALHVLDTVVRNTYKNDSAKLAEWTIASHVEKHTPVPRVKPAAAPAK